MASPAASRGTGPTPVATTSPLPRQGVVDFIDNRLNPQLGSIRLRAAFDNTDGLLLPGLLARVQVDASAPRPVVLTPDRAVGTDQSRKFVWVVGADNQPQPCDAQRALEAHVRIEIELVPDNV